MTVEVGQLGERLTSAVREAEVTTELSAAALLGNAAVRKVEVAKDQLAGDLTAIAAAQQHGRAALETANRSQESLLQRLASVSRQFDSLPDRRIEDSTKVPDGSNDSPIPTVR